MAPRKPPSTDENAGDEKLPRDTKTLLEGIDGMTPQELADFLYALAEEVISNPKEYKLKLGLEQLDINDLDKIDLSTPAGRKKLAALFRLLAAQVLKGKKVYQETVVDKGKQTGRGR